MKTKNRRSSASRSNTESDDNRPFGRGNCSELPAQDEAQSSGAGTSAGAKRKKTIESSCTITRSSKTTTGPPNTSNTSVPVTIIDSNIAPDILSCNETKTVTKNKRNTASASSGGTNTNGKSFSFNSNNRRHSQSNSSASSVLSGIGDPIDPYEFAVKAEDDVTNCGIIANVAPIKRVKLERFLHLKFLYTLSDIVIKSSRDRAIDFFIIKQYTMTEFMPHSQTKDVRLQKCPKTL
ncbi:hypothetical protein FGIG_08496 [Fasciola gigantica]|uniref:Uncharacterized protein n=1 Tax=Fasciola gigantica TaxID=46835 RepID=A0A504YDP8_FASGI|nr:hypothetical protein FGIG_08496 [Fasciola gigantica]